MKPFVLDQQAIFTTQNFLLVFYQGTVSMYKDFEFSPFSLPPKVNCELVQHKTNASYSLWPAGGPRGDLVSHTEPEVTLPGSAAGQRLEIAANLQHPVLCL